MTVLSGVVRAEGAPSCPYCADSQPLSGHRFLSADVLIVRKDNVALLELQYVPTRISGGGEVELRVLHAHEIPSTERTGASAQWFAIRFDNN